MINNEVRNHDGEVIGFRCTTCGRIYQSGWGDICNVCRETNEKHEDLMTEIKKLRLELSQKI